MLKGNISRPSIGILMKLTLFIFAIFSLLLSGCATMQVPEGPTEITLSETQGRVLVSYGEQYETAEQGRTLAPDDRVIALDRSSAKILYEVEQLEEDANFSCEVELTENSNIQISGAQDCIEDKIVSNNVNVSSEETNETIAQEQVPAEADASGETLASAEALTESNEQSIDTTVAATTVEDATDDSMAAADFASVESNSADDNSGERLATVDTSRPASRPDNGFRSVPATVSNGPESARIPFRTAELTEQDLQSIAAIKAKAARDIPLVLRSVPQHEPIYNYIDTVILLDDPYM